MKIDVNLSDDDRKRIRTLFGSNANKYIEVLAIAGAEEVLAQATGVARPGTLGDAQVYRIYRLMANGIGAEEVEAVVANLFGVRARQAQGLVAKTLAKYKLDLDTELRKKVAALLETAVWKKERWEIELPLGLLQQAVLAAADETTLPDPERAGRGKVWKFPDETYQAVRASFALPLRKPK